MCWRMVSWKKRQLLLQIFIWFCRMNGRSEKPKLNFIFTLA